MQWTRPFRPTEADSKAGIYLDASNTFLEDINPGNAVDGILVYDVPKTGVQGRQAGVARLPIQRRRDG
jgi:hypothetical protein